MKPNEVQRAAFISAKLDSFSKSVIPLPGLSPSNYKDTLVAQIIDSLRRIEYVHSIRDKTKIDTRRMDPASDLFDPLKAAVLHSRSGNYDEAYWLVFLAVHFGKHAKDGWRLARDIYGQLGTPQRWDWATVSSNPSAFRSWLIANIHILRGDGVSRRFSNHRKYESLVAPSGPGTADVIESYIGWIQPPRTHTDLIRDAHVKVGQNPQEVFNYLYKSMSCVSRFGRLAKFDYLTMLGKLGIAPIDPDSAYISEATGPLRGARLLFTGSATAKMKASILETHLKTLDNSLNVGMQTLEDALCNWQKSPGSYVYFRG